MQLSPPKQVTWWVSLAIAVVGVVGYFVTIPFVSDFAFWFLVVAFALLALGNALTGL